MGAADNSSAGLGFYRVVVQVMVWKEVYYLNDPAQRLRQLFTRDTVVTFR